MEDKGVSIEKLCVTKKFLEGAKQFFQTDSGTEAIEKLLEWFDYYQSIIPFKGRGKGKGFENTVSDKELEKIATRGPDHPRYWEALEAVARRFDAGLERKGYTLEQMLADLPVARQALWEQKYAPLLEKARKQEATND